MLIALVFAVAVVALVVALRARSRAERHRAALERLEARLAPISRRLHDSVERTRLPQATGPDRHELAPKLESLLERIAAEGSAGVAIRRLAGEVAPPEAVAAGSSSARSSSAYEAELEREIARARRTGRPLSLVLVDVDQSGEDRVLQVAALLTRVTRVTDAVCRRRRDAFGVLLPETPEDGARCFFGRVRDEATRTFGAGATTFSTGIVEWRPNESGDAFDARALAAVARPVARGDVGAPDRALDAPGSR